MLGTFYSSWILVDFYWNRDDYTQKYCQLLDQGITQCRASCYLNDLLEEKHDETSNSKIASTHKVKIIEIGSDEELAISYSLSGLSPQMEYCPSQYHFDFYSVIFHPPKA